MHEDHGVPEDVWSARGLVDDRAALAAATAQLPALLRAYGAARDRATVARFCRDQLPDGRILVSGAGTHTAFLLDQLAHRPGIKVIGLIDRIAARVGARHGLPVVTAAEAARRSFDYVLLSHTSYEGEMRRALKAAGIEPACIRAIYGDPVYGRMAAAAPDWQRRLEVLAETPVDVLIVTCDTGSLVSDRALASVFPPERTLRLYFGRDDAAPVQAGPFPVLDLQESLARLFAVVAAVRPRAIYVQSIVYKNFLGSALRINFPDLTVIQELYDYAATWADQDLVQLFGLDAVSIRSLRLAEFHAGHSADLVLSKRGGPAWQRVLARCPAPYQLVYPLIEAPPETAPVPSQAAAAADDLIYAGFLPDPRFLHGFDNGYRFLALLEQVCGDGGLGAEIFNSAHHGPATDPTFQAYLDRFACGPVRYRRRLAYDDLLAEMGRFRFGWLCDVGAERLIDHAVGIANRWTGYLSAGLPVLLSDNWLFMADLLRRFGAGIVIDRPEAGAIVRALAETPYPPLRDGALRLHRHLLDHNRHVIARIGAVADLDHDRASPGRSPPAVRARSAPVCA